MLEYRLIFINTNIHVSIPTRDLRGFQTLGITKLYLGTQYYIF